jgi:hypothetical protein
MTCYCIKRGCDNWVEYTKITDGSRNPSVPDNLANLSAKGKGEKVIIRCTCKIRAYYDVAKRQAVATWRTSELMTPSELARGASDKK